MVERTQRVFEGQERVVTLSLQLGTCYIKPLLEGLNHEETVEPLTARFTVLLLSCAKEQRPTAPTVGR